jgi:general secretion pathway protein I
MKAPRNRPPAHAAFTLVEVLVSLAIFAIAAVVLGAAYVNILSNYQAVLTRQERQNEVGFLRAALQAEPDRAKVEEGGEMALAGQGGIRWRARTDETSVADLFEVEFVCEISTPGRPEPRVERETFMLLRPTWSDPAVREKLRTATRERLAERKF